MKILIVKTSALGDIIHTFPVVEYLRNKFPDAEIDWVVERKCSEIVDAHPDVNSVVIDTKKQPWRYVKPLRRKKYDIVFDLQGNIKSGIITALARSKEKVGFSFKNTAEWPNVLFTKKRYSIPTGKNIRDDYLSVVTQHFGDAIPEKFDGVSLKIYGEQKTAIDEMLKSPIFENKKIVIVCPGTRWDNKKVSEQCLKDFLKKIEKEYSFVFVWGDDKEKAEAQRLNETFKHTSTLAEKMSLAAIQNVMAAADLVIAMDSMTLHLAGTTTTPTFTVFGPSSPKKYNPQGIQNRCFQGRCPYGETFEKRCRKLRTCSTGACIKDITGEHLYGRYIETD
ncbi:MAG: glycosyltransferase family 9 protein [Waddliaceae bacterium]|jgi:heptosyltransferase I|nr:glycosyltransferase family 9 protein [Waddliaceae bacterium]MBT3579306.1 glycosyltransferase family 9 protein [Waddliaceae bacterium]MBT4445437.1 glycosyltransferase family 9 protein [Waddliaceae bacterium]MBT6928562.1 glycosyltransferase family 9 protein [Waddliaceae bacterium]MBT7264887.1 glycosyltransferase family 9 protein [Waddliaceae bacterium]